jgi:putative transcriptional regulator
MTIIPAKIAASFRHEVLSQMSNDTITTFKLDPDNPPKTDWTAFDAMTADERQAAALADPDAQPATEAQLATARRRPNVRAIREGLGLSLEVFAGRFGLSLALVRDWEAGARWPDRPAQILLRVIERDPETVARVAAE